MQQQPMPIPVTSIGAVNTGTLLWRTHEFLHLTIIVKATLSMRSQQAMELVEPMPLVAVEKHYNDEPTGSLRGADEVVPYRQRADIWLTGRAYAPAGKPVAVSLVRLALYRQREALFDKTLYVYGDRVKSDANPAPFASMPIMYERAYGGPGCDENPVGCSERGEVPNIVSVQGETAVGGYGPISRYWKVRRERISGEQKNALQQLIASVPENFDWTYFQAAPPDQQLDYLNGDEWLVLDGLVPGVWRMQTRLPKLTGLARVWRGQEQQLDDGDAVSMVADTLSIDAEKQQCSLLWRGTVSLKSEEDLRSMRIAAGVTSAGRPIDWASHDGAENIMPVGAENWAGRPLDQSGITLVSAMPNRHDEDVLDTTAVDMPAHSDPLMSTLVDARSDVQLESARSVSSDDISLLLEDEGRDKTSIREITPGENEDEGDVTQPNRWPVDLELMPNSDPLSSTLPGQDQSAVRERSDSSVPLDPASGPHVLKTTETWMPSDAVDTDSLEQQLRRAGATEADIAAIVSDLEKME